MTETDDRQTSIALVAQVDELSEQVKNLALNMAIFLAKEKKETDRLGALEPDFMRLVNGTVKVVQDLAIIINAARNLERMIYQVPSGRLNKDHIEIKLRSILEQCHKLLYALSGEKSGGVHQVEWDRPADHHERSDD